MRTPKRRMLGMAGAAIWLVVISTVFTVLALITIGAPVPQFVLASVVVAAILQLVIGVRVIRAILRSPGAIPPRTTEDRTMLRRFAVVGVGEVIAIMVVNGICAVTQHLELLVPLDLLIVGIHFLPLARVFRVPRYYFTGGLFALVSMLTLVLVPAHAQVGAADAWFVIPTFGCSAVAWVTSAFNLREVATSLSGQHTGRS
ncbi:MAG: hypothetical protein ACXVZZ_10530 [Terriglobales bacterium]